jgi:hypothetical protein
VIKSRGIDKDEGEERRSDSAPARLVPVARGGRRESGWGMGLRKRGREIGERGDE